MIYQITKEQCQKNISGVCPGCSGELQPIETDNNAGEPTYWPGCIHCSAFRSGIEKEYFEIARELIEHNEMVPYSHMQRSDYEGNPNKFIYWLDCQTAGLSHNIKRTHQMLKEKFNKEQL